MRHFLILALLSAPAAAQTVRDDPATAASRDLASQRAGAPAATDVRAAPGEQERYAGCVRAVPTNAPEAERYAGEWRARGGGLPARHCMALAQLEQGKAAAAAATLVAAARAAEAERSPVAADFWGQAGNAALLAGDATAALSHFGAGIALGGGAERLVALRIDRARAAVEAGQTELARTDLDAAVAAQPSEPAAWLLRAALARRGGDLPRAQADIAQAVRLDPASPDVRFEAANIAAAAGDTAAARAGWQAVVRDAPGTPAAELAAKALAPSP